jgi:hypothetical protein
LTEERLTLISEPIDPGAVVDTHPRMNFMDAKGRPLIDIRAEQANCASAEMGGMSAEGFVRGHKDGDLEVVVYRRGKSVGIAPLGRAGMEIGVTWWSRFIASPIVQTGVALFGVLFVTLQVLTSNRRVLWRSKKNLASGSGAKALETTPTVLVNSPEKLAQENLTPKH